MFRFVLTGLMIYACLIFPVYGADEIADKESTAVSVEEERSGRSKEMLTSIIELKKSLISRIEDKNKQLKASSSEMEKENLKQELATLDQQLDGAKADFERIATGIDIDLFSDKKEEIFNWQDELISLVEPGIKELKRFTLKARQKAKLKEDIQHYQRLLPVAREAFENVNSQMEKTTDKGVKRQLKMLLPEWQGVVEQLDNRLKVAHLQLDTMEQEEKSLMELSRTSMRDFFRTRGLYLLMAVGACVMVLLLLRFIYGLTIRTVPGFKSGYRPFYARLMDLLFKVMAIVFSLVALILVFYLAEDWVLLSLTIIILLGLGWGIKSTLPGMWQQSRLMLNIGAVREGERLVMDGVPWMVKRINMFSQLENPDLGMKLRIPIESLVGKTSRPFAPEESWFPCRKNDWVILADGTRGKVVSLSHEMVELVQRGGSRKLYQTGDFLGQTPLNISVNFRLKVVFGIGYEHQKEATSGILTVIREYLGQALEKEGYNEHLVNLNVEFCQAGASSLDFVVIADFDGEVAPLYNRLNRAIQRWCVDVCTLNHWGIPFPQLTVHKP
ncbi:hypothetical protein SAMN02746065_102188 [Desulfocicer vacuolatum DSM 3385]|uniref:Mechanosensitive ion channel n=1 Tax=Desulfocicer vacuolatum DSM 3385 TaxID=1121400 RepID=A0A1W1ZDE4_9BACT|nr:hypothetical protein [Desulfocicer vacuolatum]SMC46048.1 hypothetical protein SAMN02746065_102188 [Desulfocicer vacuolatum DSM 3385]